MTQAVSQILKAVEALSAEEQADLSDCIVQTMARDVSPEVAETQIDEVRRRIADVESGRVELIPGEVAMARIWSRFNERRQSL